MRIASAARVRPEEVLINELGHRLAHSWPVVTSKRKWIPPQTTLFSASAAAAEKLVNECVTPVKSSDVKLKLTLSRGRNGREPSRPRR